MTIEEFIYTMTEQIRCKKAREPVGVEIKSHILDQAESYKEEGLTEDEAMAKAVREMGDPVEIGAAMDRIHRPKLSWDMMILVGIISIFSIILHGVMKRYSVDQDISGYYLKNQICYTIAGYLLMLAVYRMDYSFLGKHSRLAAVGFLILMTAGGLNIRIAMWLFVPLYGALLYGHRGEGYGVIWKMFFWAAVPVILLCRIPSIQTAYALGLSYVVLFSVAVWKGWYHVNKKAVLAGIWSMTLAAPLLLAGTAYSGYANSYRAARLRAFLFCDRERDYVTGKASMVLGSSHFMGRNTESLIQAINDIPGCNSDYILVSLTAAYGILAGILVTGLLLWMIGKIFRISFGQKNHLGMMIGCGCGTVLLIQTVFCVLVNLGLCPRTSVVLPFISCGGSEIVVSYILLGLSLSIYRYKDILTERHVRKMVETVS